jgi:hypothetical protein
LHVHVAAATRPHPGEIVNGDAWTVQWHDGACRVAVIDGLGHGPQAAAAAQAAVRALAGAPHLGPEEALRVCHAALAGTRGAGVSVARIAAPGDRLTFAGVGNVEARLWQPDRLQRPLVLRGIVGAVLPSPRAFDFALHGDWVLLVHTDGVQMRSEPETLRAFARRDLQTLADEIIARWARPMDDATAVVVAPAPEGGVTPDAHCGPVVR